MAAPTGTTTSINMATANREDLEDKIYLVAPEQTPFLSSIGKEKISNTYHAWQTEALATPNATNAQFEGNDYTTFATNVPTRVGNTSQIFSQTYAVSGTQQYGVRTAGASSNLGRLKAIATLQLRRDMEAAAIANKASVPTENPGVTARALGGALAWLVTNTSTGASGSNGGFSAGTVTAATNGTQRANSETILKSVLASMFNNGANVDGAVALMAANQKQNFAAFPGLALNRMDNSGSKQMTIMAGADIYLSDFGKLSIKAHPYFSTRDCLIYDTDMWSWGVQRPAEQVDLATTGDAEKKLVIAEGTLICRNEKGSGVLRDLL